MDKRALRTQKVTAGNPSLDAMKRYLKERHAFQHMKADQAVQDAETGKKSLFQKDGHLDPTNEAQMKGKSYTSQQVIAKLSKLNRRLHFERSVNHPDKVGIYIEHPEGQYKGWVHIMGMPYGEVPQYSMRKPDPSGQRMLIEKRGWMKLLVDLTRMGIINLEEAKRKFVVGDVSHNFAKLTGAR